MLEGSEQSGQGLRSRVRFIPRIWRSGCLQSRRLRWFLSRWLPLRLLGRGAAPRAGLGVGDKAPFGRNSRGQSPFAPLAVKKQRKPPAVAKSSTPVFIFSLSADSTEGEDDGPKWVQVAAAGVYKGYDSGTVEFTFDKELFDKVVANFRKSPSYKAGLDGKGSSPVLAWDFHHASELHPAAVASNGAPAQGWTLDLEVRDGEKGAELWALVAWLEPLRTYIKEERYRWASVSMHFDAVDAITGEQIGPVITSIAATNSPFIEGMAPLAASRGYYGPAASPAEALEVMRRMFKLPAMATSEEVAVQVAKLETLLGGALDATGIDGDGMICDLREILGLPALTAAAEVLTKTREVIASGSSIGAAQTSTSLIAASTDGTETDQMDIKILASKLGVREADKAVEARLEELLALETAFEEVAKALDAEKGADAKAVLDKASRASKSLQGLASILKACGVEAADQALAKIAESFATVEAAQKAMPELESLRAFAKKAEEEEEEKDVKAAMSSRSYTDEGVKLALTVLRKTDKKAFFERFPVIAPEHAHLTKTIAATAEGVETPVAAKKIETASTPDGFAELKKYPGRTDIERAMEMIKATNAAAKGYTLEQIFPLACEHVRALKKSA